MKAILLAIKRLRFALMERLRYAGFSYVVGGAVACVAAVVVLFTATPAGQVLQNVAQAAEQAFSGSPPPTSPTPEATPIVEPSIPAVAAVVLPLLGQASPTVGISFTPVPATAIASATPIPASSSGGGGQAAGNAVASASAAPANAPAAPANAPAPTVGSIANPPVATATSLLQQVLSPAGSVTATIQSLAATPTPAPRLPAVQTVGAAAATAVRAVKSVPAGPVATSPSAALSKLQ